MSKTYIQIGTYNDHSQDHSKHVTVNVPPGTNPADLIRAALAEDITPAEDSSFVSDNLSDSRFPYLTQKCIQEKRVETVEAEIQAARKGTAETMWRTLWNNENLGYLEVEPIDATTLYRAIEKHYGKLPYKVRNFRDARNKR